MREATCELSGDGIGGVELLSVSDSGTTDGEGDGVSVYNSMPDISTTVDVSFICPGIGLYCLWFLQL